MPDTRKPFLMIKVRRKARRERSHHPLRATGLRAITLRVRDVGSPAFQAEAKRQLEQVRTGGAERDFAAVWAPNQDATGWNWTE